MIGAIITQLYIFIKMVSGDSCLEKSIETSKTCQLDFYEAMRRNDGRDCKKHFEVMGICLSNGVTCHTRLSRDAAESEVYFNLDLIIYTHNNALGMAVTLPPQCRNCSKNGNSPSKCYIFG